MSRSGEEPRSLFGTDGIRGVANQEPMTAETAMKVGAAAGSLFVRGDHRHRVVIGKDTRLSGYLFEPALAAGFISVGMDVILVGPMPTPAVAMLTRALRADLGVMISASHNLFADNGIKLFGPDGYKLSDEMEARIEAAVDTGAYGLAAPDSLGRARRLDDAEGRYVEFVKNSFPQPLDLEGRRIVIDCAMGLPTRWPRPFFGSSAPKSSPLAPSPTASTSTGATARPKRQRLPAQSWNAARISGSRWTATPTGS